MTDLEYRMIERMFNRLAPTVGIDNIRDCSTDWCSSAGRGAALITSLTLRRKLMAAAEMHKGDPAFGQRVTDPVPQHHTRNK